MTSPDAMTVLAEAFVRGSDADVVEIARRSIETTKERSQVDAAANVVVATGDERLADLLAGLAETPSEPRLRALVYFLAGEFDRYEQLDFDGALLRAAHAVADKPLRRALAERARGAGRLDWVWAIAGGRAGSRPALTMVEWDAAAGMLAAAGQWEELLRLTSAARATWVARVLAGVDRTAWQPQSPSDRAAFTELIDLATKAHATPEPRASAFGDSPSNRLRGRHVHSLALAASGKLLITGGGQAQTQTWRLPSGKQKGLLGLGEPDVISMATSPDGRRLVTGNLTGGLKLWTLPGGDFVGEFVGHRKKVVAIAISPDGKLVASGGYDRHIRLWNVATRTTINTLDADPVWTASLAITPDGKLLASGGALGNLRLWHLPSGALHRKLRGHSSHVAAMAISSDGTLLASGSYDNTIRLWRLPSGEPAGVLKGHTGHLLALAMTPDGKLLASTGKDRTVRLWHLPAGEPAGQLGGHHAQVECLRISSDGLLLVSGSTAGSVIWWTRENSPLSTLTERRLDQVTAIDLDRLRRSAGDFSPADKAWFDLIAALVRWRGRHDIEVTDDVAIASGDAWDIEVDIDGGIEAGGTADPPATRKRPPARRKGKRTRKR